MATLFKCEDKFAVILQLRAFIGEWDGKLVFGFSHVVLMQIKPTRILL